MTQITDPGLIEEEKYPGCRRIPVSPLAAALADAERLTDSREREEAKKTSREDYASGRMKLGYPDVLTKRYRVFWDEDGQLVFDPEEEHESGSTTMGGPAYAFESDDLREVQELVRDLRLVAPREEEVAR